MIRLVDWQPRFWAHMHAATFRPFVWGEHDCVLFGAGTLDAITEGGFVARVKARYVYTSALEAARLMPNGLQPLIEEFLGPLGHAARLSIGDLVLCRWEDREALCVHDGHQILGPDERGLTRVRYQYAIGGWQV